MTKLDYGFVAPVFSTEQKVLGSFNALPRIIYQPDYDWTPYLPTYEPQYGDGWETYGCSVWGTENAIECFEKRLTGKDVNYSERYIYLLAGIRPPGGDPHNVAVTIKEQGLVYETDLPFTKTYEEFLTPRPMTNVLLDKGQVWKKRFNFGHEWVFQWENNQQKKLELLKSALQYSPLGISVCAWYPNDKGQYYSPLGMSNNHWVVLYKIDDKGLYVFDSYSQDKKLLTLDHNIQFAKRYNLVDIKQNLVEQISILTKIVNLLKLYVSKFCKVGGEILAGIFSPSQD